MPTPDRSPRPGSRAALGAYGERVAVRALTDAGLTVLDRNWRCRDGELDLVARDGDALVFCEVKTRTGSGFGSPAEAVTPVKRRRLRALASAWLAAHDHHAPDLRFDVVGIVVPATGRPQVTHLRNAF
ncbi:YraN family protein [Modestobacter sp. SSW1-42]|uniref:YraN family protein n=1 Tax=Modestobacter sp. SSW1-42 TaxID=596372 RepID=UPI003987A672